MQLPRFHGLSSSALALRLCESTHQVRVKSHYRQALGIDNESYLL